MQSGFITFLTELDNQLQSKLLVEARLKGSLLCSEHQDEGGDVEEVRGEFSERCEEVRRRHAHKEGCQN